MSTVTLSLTASAFSITPTWTVEQFHQALAASLSAGTTTSNVMLGQVGGSAPLSNVGPWLNGTTLFAWNSGSSTYVPATIKIGDATNQITLAGTPTANRTITIPDATGTLALTSDINRATVSPTLAATVNIDWSLSNSFAIPLDRNITITNSNSLSGQEIQVTIYNPAAAVWTVAWGADVHYVSTPTQSTNNKTDNYWLRNVAGTICGRYLQAYA